MVQAVPIAIAGALSRKTYYFVPLALSDRRGSEATLVAPAYTPELGDQAICHRNVTLTTAPKASSSPPACSATASPWPSSSSSTSATPSSTSSASPRPSTSSSGARPSPTSAAKPARTPGRAATSPSTAQPTRSTANPSDRREGQEQLPRSRLLRRRRHLPALALRRLRLLRAARTRVPPPRPASPRRPPPPRSQALPPKPRLRVRHPLPPPRLIPRLHKAAAQNC